MKYTLSLHMGGSKANQSHNIRDEKSISKSGNIDKTKTKDNITIIHEPIKKAYKRLFQKSVDEYNSKQTHADRIKKNYFTEIEKSKKHVAYELIIQVGGVKEGQPQNLEALYTQYVYDFQKRNSNMQIVGAYIHNDEASQHLHLDVMPVDFNCKRGMRVQNSLTGALKAQGFKDISKKQTSQIQWEQSERDALRELCKTYHIDLQE